MLENLNKFTTFALHNATLDEAKDFAIGLGADTNSLSIYENLTLPDTEQIRIKTYEFTEKIYAFLIGKANIESQNALLKLTEESITRSCFIFYETEYILDTLLSRAQIINFKIKTDSVNKLYETFLLKDRQKFFKELLQIKEETKQNKSIILKYLKAFIYKLSNEPNFKFEALLQEYQNFRKYNLNIDLFISFIVITLWRQSYENSICDI